MIRDAVSGQTPRAAGAMTAVPVREHEVRTLSDAGVNWNPSFGTPVPSGVVLRLQNMLFT